MRKLSIDWKNWAQQSCNPDLLRPLLADKVVITSSKPKVTNNAEALATGRNTKWDRLRFADANLTVFGDTVVATGDFKAEGTDASGKPFVVHERWTHTWVKMASGQWQCAAIHTSAVTMCAEPYFNCDDVHRKFAKEVSWRQ